MKKRTVISIIAAIACFLVLGVIYIGLIRHDLETERERYGYIAKNEAEHIITTIDCVMARTNTLKALIQDHHGDTSFFNDVAEDVYNAVTEETGVTLKNFAVAPDGVVSDVYPLAGNEALVGFDFMDMSRPGNAEAKKAYESGSTVLTNPFELVQGGLGMGGRSPVILQDGDERKLWGLVTVTLDFENLMDVLRLDNLKGMGVDYALSCIDEDGGSRLMHGSDAMDEHAVKTVFSVRNLTWELSVAPQKGWVSVWRVVFSVLLLLLISGFAGLFTSVLIQLHETNGILLRLSKTDSLTGGLNRRAYEDAITEYAHKSGDKDLIYISADINGLKKVNDTLGHPAGDELINGASKCMQDTFGEYGNVYRIGGDEFVALIRTDEQSVDGLMKKLESLTKAWKGKGVKELSMSAGNASYREFPDATVETLTKIADERMYQAKRAYYQTKGLDRRMH